MISIGQQLVNNSKKRFITESVKRLSNIDASIAEVGVYYGGTATMIADNESKNTIYLFDTFDGMPFNCEGGGLHKIGDFKDVKDRYDEIILYFKKYKNVKICKGIFPFDTGHIIKKNEMFKFVHIDVDVYQSYKLCLSFFYDRMIKGGIMLFDDYDAPSCFGAKKACDEFFKDKIEDIQKIMASYLIIKL